MANVEPLRMYAFTNIWMPLEGAEVVGLITENTMKF